MENEFPPNSHTRKETRTERTRTEKAPTRKEVVRVTKGKATLRKRPLRKRLVDAFRPEDNVGFVEYTLFEVLVPGIKDALADAVHGTVDNALGSSARGRSRGRRRESYTSYNRMSSSRSRRDRDRDRDRDDDRRSSRSRESRVADDVREVILDSRVEAEEVLETLIELSSMYEAATMRDLLRLIGEPVNPVHEDWGWYDLRGSRIHKVGGGYLLDLPRPEPLD